MSIFTAIFGKAESVVKFSNPITSIAGIKERSVNLVNQVKAIPSIWSGQSEVKVGSGLLPAVAKIAVEHPIITVGTIAGGAYLYTSPTAVKTIISAVGVTAKANPIKTAVAVALTPVVVPFAAGLAKSETARETILDIPSKGFKVGDDAARILDMLSSGKPLSNEDKLLLAKWGAMGLGAGITAYGAWKLYKTMFPEYYKDVDQKIPPPQLPAPSQNNNTPQIVYLTNPLTTAPPTSSLVPTPSAASSPPLTSEPVQPLAKSTTTKKKAVKKKKKAPKKKKKAPKKKKKAKSIKRKKKKKKK